MSDTPLTQPHHSTDCGFSSNDADWQACPHGTLTGLAARQRSRVVRRRLSNGVAVLAGCLLLLAPVLLMRNVTDPAPVNQPYGGLSCHEVVERMDAFFAASLQAPFRQRVLKHLNDCPSCQRQYQRTANELQVEIASLPTQVDLRNRAYEAGPSQFAVSGN